MTAVAQELNVEAGRRPVLAMVVTSSLSMRLIQGQARYLRERGFEVVIMSAPGKDLQRLGVAEGVRVEEIAMQREIAPLADLASLWRLASRLRKLRPDLVNVSTPKAGLIGGIAAVLARVPLRIYTIRGLRFETTRGAKRILLRALEKIACACAHRVVCVSPSLREQAVLYRLAPAGKLSVVGDGSSNGVDAALFAPSPEARPKAGEIRARMGIGEVDPVIGFVGRFTRDKGIRELVEAYETLRVHYSNLHLLLVGGFEPGDPAPQDIRKNMEHSAGIHMTGFVGDPMPYYHVFDILALPTYREGFPNVVLEAQAAAKPVVTTRATGAVDSIEDGRTGLLVPAGNAAELANALAALLADPRRARAMGAAGRQRVLDRFLNQTVWEHWEKLLRETLAANPRSRTLYRWAKRTLDVLGAGVGLLLLSPFLALIAWAVRWKLGSPVLFRQQRPGWKARPFVLLKFRTMRDAHSPDGGLLPDADRLTPLGNFLRSTSLDELPELWNVLRGGMSLVGPRPLLMEYLDRYTPEQMRRHDVLPGITGWAQINGRNAASWEQKFRLDLWYVDHQNFFLDLKVLALTLLKTVTRQGIAQEGYATMPEFQGNGRRTQDGGTK
jgi:lipopolysaccharide/colanic/teichoic acid biosynthesis glycosyltransferase